MSKNISKNVVIIYIGMYLLLIILQIVLFLTANIDWDNEQTTVRVNSIMNLAFYGIMFLLYIGLFTNFWKKVVIQFKQNKKYYLKLIGLGFVALVAVSAFIGLGYELLGINETSDNQASLDALLNGGWFDKFSLVIFAVFLAPLVEEMVFRMATFNFLFRSKDIKPWVVIAISSVLFGLIHVIGTFDFIQIFYYAGLGLILGYFVD